jgi:hypothetical protein
VRREIDILSRDASDVVGAQF